MMPCHRAALGALALFAATTARADALQDKLVAAARATPESAYTRSLRMEQRSVGTPEVETRVDRYDPTRAEGQRWTLVGKGGKPPTPKEAAEYAKVVDKVPAPGYYRLARWIGGRASTADGRVYRYPALPAGILIINGRDISPDTAAEVTVNRDGAVPWVERTHLVSTTPFRMMFVAKVERVEAYQTYRLENGRPVLAETVTEMTGSMMGKAGSMKTVATYSYAPPSR